MFITSSSTAFNTFRSSTGTAFDGGWQRWWEIEARITGTDWESLLRQHGRVFQQLCELQEISS
jgi:hypothetical protein